MPWGECGSCKSIGYIGSIKGNAISLQGILESSVIFSLNYRIIMLLSCKSPNFTISWLSYNLL